MNLRKNAKIERTEPAPGADAGPDAGALGGMMPMGK